MIGRRVQLGLIACLLAFAASACAANACVRRQRYFENRCRSAGIVYNGDYLCEKNLENCDAGQKRAFEDYVACLESNAECSMETNARCAALYPEGVNLQCISKKS
jgi:hypothetical protein